MANIVNKNKKYQILKKQNNLFISPCVFASLEHTKFENNVKKLSVKFLDISFCHNQHNHMPKRNNLCIWTHQKEDCWVFNIKLTISVMFKYMKYVQYVIYSEHCDFF